MFCTQCRTQVPDSARYCAKCGAPTVAEDQAVTRVSAAIEPAAAVPAGQRNQESGPGPFDYYVKAFANYANFKGRARRGEYWFFVLFNMVATIGAAIIDGFLGTELFYGLYVLGSLLPAVAAGVRRLHDVDKSGWFLLVPIYNLVLACTEGTRGPNSFGADPRPA